MGLAQLKAKPQLRLKSAKPATIAIAVQAVGAAQLKNDQAASRKPIIKHADILRKPILSPTFRPPRRPKPLPVVRRPITVTIPVQQRPVLRARENIATSIREARRKAKRQVNRSWRADVNDLGSKYADIFDVQCLVGLQGSHAPNLNDVLVSIDCEWEQNDITEIGISTLRVGDVHGTPFGQYGNNWLEKVKHYHLVLTNRSEFSTTTSLFGRSELLTSEVARDRVLEIFRSLVPDNVDGRIALVGQSVMGDVRALFTDPHFHLDIRTAASPAKYHQEVFDTFGLGLAARTCFPSLQLGSLARAAGVAPKYHARSTLTRNSPGIYLGAGHGTPVVTTTKTLIGVHNASNDAAYALMTLLLLGQRWNDLTGEIGHRMESQRQWRETNGASLPLRREVERVEDVSESSGIRRGTRSERRAEILRKRRSLHL